LIGEPYHESDSASATNNQRKEDNENKQPNRYLYHSCIPPQAKPPTMRRATIMMNAIFIFSSRGISPSTGGKSSIPFIDKLPNMLTINSIDSSLKDVMLLILCKIAVTFFNFV
jgi:hypothetical protein